MKNFFKNFIIVFIILIVLSAIYSFYYSSPQSTETIPLNQIVSDINNGNVTKITIQENKLEIELKDGTKKISQKEGEAGLTESLKNLGVDQEKLKEVSLEVKSESGATYWIINLLPFLLRPPHLLHKPSFLHHNHLRPCAHPPRLLVPYYPSLLLCGRACRVCIYTIGVFLCTAALSTRSYTRCIYLSTSRMTTCSLLRKDLCIKVCTSEHARVKRL